MFTTLLLHPFADPLSTILWCLYAAVFFALCYAVCKNIGAEKIIKALADAEAFSPEKAKEICEAGVKKTAFTRFALRKNAMIWNIVSVLDDEEGGDPFRKKLWLAPEKQRKAESFAKTGRISIPAFLFALVGTYLVICILYHFLPIIIPDISQYLH